MAKFTVLVADDDQDIRDGIEIYLKNEGYDVLKAADGKEALELLEANDVHLLILDIMMPNMDGFALLQAIKDRQELADIPVVVVTSKDLTRDELDWLAVRANEVVRKGTKGRTDLIAALKRHFPLTEEA